MPIGPLHTPPGGQVPLPRPNEGSWLETIALFQAIREGNQSAAIALLNSAANREAVLGGLLSMLGVFLRAEDPSKLDRFVAASHSAGPPPAYGARPVVPNHRTTPLEKPENPMTRHVSVIVGSLRRGSFARKIAQNVIAMFPAGYTARIVEIRDLPLYDFDYDDPEVTDKPVPAEYTAFRETIKASDGVLFVTPENNRTIPACLKNCVDIGSKPNSDVAWKGKPVGIISHSVGRMGGYSSQKNLRLALSYFDVRTPGQPEVFIGQSPTLFEGGEHIVPESTRSFLNNYVERLIAVVEAHDHR